MPESKSKRKPKRGRSRRPPAVQTPPRRRKTARWVPYAFFSLMGSGVVVILWYYVFLQGQPGWVLFVGLGLMASAFAVSTRWY